MTAQQAVDAIAQRAWIGREPGLSRTQTLLKTLGNPEKKLKFVHIAGTNGKGSTAAMTASMLRAAGYTVGLFTSPHLYRFNERIVVDGTPVSDDMLVEVVQRILTASEALTDHPTEFELMTAVGMEVFCQSGCDIVVLEVGLGGRLDSTNVITTPEVAVITNIGLDHTGILGDTREKIAAEKAGIIKAKGDVVCYGQSQEVEDVVRATCDAVGAHLICSCPEELLVEESNLEGQTFFYRGNGPFHISLLGAHQLKNAAVALEIADMLQRRGWNIPTDAIQSGLAQAQWAGRLELIGRSPDFIVDGGHNAQCVDALITSIEGLYPVGAKFVFLIGLMGDKDYPDMVARAVPLASGFVTIAVDSPRALSPVALAQHLAQYHLPTVACDTVADGVRAALTMAGKDGMICAFGSLYSVGEIRHIFGHC